MDLPVVQRIPANAAVESVDAGGELRGGKGFGHIVVGPGHEAGDLVHLLGEGGEHDNADLGVPRADAPADLKAVHIREHDVQQGHPHIGIQPKLLQGLLTGGRLNGLIACPVQVDYHEAANICLVLQNQHFFHGSAPFRWLLFPSLWGRERTAAGTREPSSRQIIQGSLHHTIFIFDFLWFLAKFL